MTNGMSLAIRDGTPDDAALLAPAFAALGYPDEPATLRARLTAMVAEDSTARILIAEIASVVVGFACLHETPMPHRPTAVGRITAIAGLNPCRVRSSGGQNEAGEGDHRGASRQQGASALHGEAATGT